MPRLFKIFLALDQFFGALLFDGIFPDESAPTATARATGGAWR